MKVSKVVIAFAMPVVFIGLAPFPTWRMDFIDIWLWCSLGYAVLVMALLLVAIPTWLRFKKGSLKNTNLPLRSGLSQARKREGIADSISRTNVPPDPMGSGFMVPFHLSLLLHSIILFFDRNKLGISPVLWRQVPKQSVMPSSHWAIDLLLRYFHDLILTHDFTINVAGIFGIFFYGSLTLLFWKAQTMMSRYREKIAQTPGAVQVHGGRRLQ